MLGFIVVLLCFNGILLLVSGWSTEKYNSKFSIMNILISKAVKCRSDAMKGLVLASVSSMVFGGPESSIARTGAENFQASCTGCHAGGGTHFHSREAKHYSKRT